MYEFPFLAAATFAGFILPQAIGLRDNPAIAESMFTRGMWMTILCAGACYAGYILVPRKKPPLSVLRENSAIVVSGVLTSIGALFFYWISRLPPELTETSQWTGAPVALLFFAKALSCGLALATLEWARTRSRAALGIALFGLALYLDRIVVAGRRQVAAELLFILALGVWFGRKWAPSRWTAVPVLALGALFLFSTSEFRSSRLEHGKSLCSTMVELHLFENLKAVLQTGGPEFQNALLSMAKISQTHAYDFGLFNWNRLVKDFVPAQLVGTEFKKELLNSKVAETNDQLTSDSPIGSTLTGMTDAFSSFGYFGFVKFLMIGLIMGWLYRRAVSGRLTEQAAYMLFVVPSLHSITHSTQFFFSSALHTLLFLLPACYWLRGVVGAKEKRAPEKPTPPARQAAARQLKQSVQARGYDWKHRGRRDQQAT